MESVKFSTRLRAVQDIESGTLLKMPGVDAATATGIVSPWSDGQLNSFVWSDIYGLNVVPVTRKEAMSVPAVAASRHRIVQLADRPLLALRGADDVTSKQSWLYRTNMAVTPWQRIASTLDDWIFYGDSLWIVERGAKPEGSAYGPILDAVHAPYYRWRVDPETREILVDEQPVPAESVIYLPGPFEGLLNVASETVRAAKALERAWSSRVRNPAPTVILEEREDGTVTGKEATRYTQAVAKALRDPDGAVFFVPQKINLRLESGGTIDVLDKARNAVRIDIANLLNLNASALDGAKAQSSLTYETQETERAELQDRLAFWTAPLEHRLSMDDVVPRGTRVRFDFATTTPAQTGTPTED